MCEDWARERGPAASDLIAGTIRDWRSGARSLSVCGLDGSGGAADLAGSAAGAGGIWRVALSALLGVRRESIAAESGDASGARVALGRGPGGSPGVRGRPRGLRARDPLEDGAAAQGVRTVPAGFAVRRVCGRECGVARTV